MLLNNLNANTRYYYKIYLSSSLAGVGDEADVEHSFITSRSKGSSFTFGVQGDSHPERGQTEWESTLYQRTMNTVANDNADLYFLLGDDFSVDTTKENVISQSLVSERYKIQRPYLGSLGASTSIYLVNGGHEQAAKYLQSYPDGSTYSANNRQIPIWAQNARNSFFSQPADGEGNGFYTGNAEKIPGIDGDYLRNYFAFNWGDATFITLDPYWASSLPVDEPYPLPGLGITSFVLFLFII